MKTLGLIGGISWKSTTIYYRLINEARLGGLHSARMLLWSFDFAPIAEHQAAGAWDDLATEMVDAARRLANAGADALIICSNTMHKLYDDVQASVAIPILRRHMSIGFCEAKALPTCQFRHQQNSSSS
jgi:aspartate racemase